MADEATLPHEILSTLDPISNLGDLEWKQFNQWYDVTELTVERKMDVGILGVIKYRPKVSDDQPECIKVGPFDVRLIGDKEQSKLLSKILNLAVKLMLYDKAYAAQDIN